jgi:HEAT repeat protein
MFPASTLGGLTMKLDNMDKEQYEKQCSLYHTMKSKSDDALHKVILQGEKDEKHAAASTLTTRGGRTNFRKAVEFCRSTDPSVREQGAFVLGQLGTPERPYSEESVPILISLLENDPDEDVRAAAAFALGHLGNPQAISHLIDYANDESVEIKFGVAFSLGCFFESPEVVAPLISLSADADEDVRNWATFGLGTCLDIDTKELRDALVARLSDEAPEIRGEALVGLAKRKDERVIEPLKRELSGEFFGDWCLEAAELMSDPVFYPLLLSLRERIDDEEGRFVAQADNAIAACKP